jgi:hypothetical protein
MQLEGDQIFHKESDSAILASECRRTGLSSGLSGLREIYDREDMKMEKPGDEKLLKFEEESGEGSYLDIAWIMDIDDGIPKTEQKDF